MVYKSDLGKKNDERLWPWKAPALAMEFVYEKFGLKLKRLTASMHLQWMCNINTCTSQENQDQTSIPATDLSEGVKSLHMYMLFQKPSSR